MREVAADASRDRRRLVAAAGLAALGAAGKRTRLLQPGQTARLTVAFPKAGKYHYACTVFGHEAAGMHGIFTVR